jgi:hypothetical protein
MLLGSNRLLLSIRYSEENPREEHEQADQENYPPKPKVAISRGLSIMNFRCRA